MNSWGGAGADGLGDLEHDLQGGSGRPGGSGRRAGPGAGRDGRDRQQARHEHQQQALRDVHPP